MKGHSSEAESAIKFPFTAGLCRGKLDGWLLYFPLLSIHFLREDKIPNLNSAALHPPCSLGSRVPIHYIATISGSGGKKRFRVDIGRTKTAENSCVWKSTPFHGKIVRISMTFSSSLILDISLIPSCSFQNEVLHIKDLHSRKKKKISWRVRVRNACCIQ